MKTTAYGALVAGALIVSALSAQGAGADTGVEFGFMPSTMTVTLLNEGGKYVAIDLKHIPQGELAGWTRMPLLRGLVLVPPE